MASLADISLTGQRTIAPADPSTAGVLRVTALMAAGSLLAASATLLSIARDFPNPWQQALAALVTLALALAVGVSAVRLSGTNHRAYLIRFGVYTLVVVSLPLLRYVTPIFTFAYERDVESVFPPIWPYSASIPLLMALLGEMAFSHRQRRASVLLVLVSLVPASLLLFFSSEMVRVFGATMLGIVFPSRVLFAYIIFIAASSGIVIGTVAATRGMAWVGVLVLIGVGLFLEISSTFFYGIASPKLFDPGFPQMSLWVPIAAGTVPGGLTLLMSVLVVMAIASMREPAYG